MKLLVLICLAISFSSHGFTQSNEKTYINYNGAIDSEAIANWINLGYCNSISPNGRYFLYTIEGSRQANSKLIIRSIDDSYKMEYDGISDFACFTDDNKQVVFNRNDTLFIKGIENNSNRFIAKISSFKMPQSQGRWIAYSKKNSSNSEMILYDVLSDHSTEWKNVKNCFFDEKGGVLILARERKQDNNWIKYLTYVNLYSFNTTELWADTSLTYEGLSIENIVFGNEGAKLAFVIKKEKKNSIWYFKDGMANAKLKVDDFSTGIDKRLHVKGQPQFSNNGQWIFFELQIEEDAQLPLENNTKVDIWSYKDIVLQPEQQRKLGLGGGLRTRDMDRGIIAVVDVDRNDIRRLEFDDEVIVTDPGKVTGTHVVVKTQNSVQEPWWKLNEQPSFYIMSLETGERRLLKKQDNSISNFSFSPNGNFLAYWDWKMERYFCYGIKNSKLVDISEKIPSKISMDYRRALHSPPVSPIIGWFSNDSALMLYDNYDIWKVDPKGVKSPYNITNSYGLRNKIKLRFLEEVENKIYNGDEKLILTGFNSFNKYNGFLMIDLKVRKDPVLLYMGPYTFYRRESQKPHFYSFDNGMKPYKAKENITWIVKRQSATEAPNYYSTVDFKKFTQLSNLQPQKNYIWVTTELVTWKMLDGKVSQGILYKPNNFNPQKKYPIIFNYYEALSHRLYEFPHPGYSNSNINIPWFVSRGYLVFTPDIYYSNAKETGQVTGSSAFNSIVSAARYLIKLPYVDGKKMALQGHSFGGGQTNYIITHTSIFAAAAEAAGGSDPLSSYLTLIPFQGSIEHYSNQYNFEMGRGLMDATPWERPDLYRKNSAVLSADKVNTPLLIMHNMRDNQIQWRQGVELYMALRRLQKRVWMLQYDNGTHGLFGADAIDYTLRLTQFFDYYLKDSVPPKWMTKGVPSKLKGIDSGLQLDYDRGKP